MPSTLIKNCDWIVTQDGERKIIKNASVLIEDGVIIEVGRPQETKADIVLDGAGKIALPGLINTHTHLSMTLFRGFADDMILQTWLEEKIWPLERKLTGEACYYGALLGLVEMMMSGTTTFVDMYFYMEDVARAVAESGLRGFLSYGMIDLFSEEKAEREQANTIKFLRYVKDLNNPRVRFILGPHAPYTCSPDMLLWAGKVAEENDTLVHLHVAETRREQAESEARHGMRVVEYLKKIGALSSRLLAAHCVWLTKSEVKLLAETGARVAHCPISNMKLASGGTAPLPEMFEAGVPVGLGTDGAASNNSLDMFETMKVCALLHKAQRWDPTCLNAQKVLDLATIEGARALGIQDQVGSIEAGKKADLILMDGKAPNMTPIHDPKNIPSHLVYSANAGNVDSMIVDGRILMMNRIVKFLEVEDIRSRAEEAALRLTHG